MTCDLIAQQGLVCEACRDAGALCEEIEAGAAVALVTEEVLGSAAVTALAGVLARQPPWSDFPFVVFSDAGRSSSGLVRDALRPLGNVIYLDRPVNVRTMVAAVRSAIRGRQRQYQGRQAIRSRDQFLAMLGHELRNPLAAIRLASELQSRADDAPAREHQRSVIDRQVRHLVRLVDDLLDVARVTNGKVVLERAPLDLGELLRASFASHEPAAQAMGLDYRLSVPKRPLMIDGDRVRLEQVFGNLLTNAIKYTPRGGAVRVEATHDGAVALARVIDTGVGIDPAMLDQVFELFAQVDRSLDRSAGGLGIGLTLVRNLVRLHGGEVEARSPGLGHGTDLRVRLPLRADQTPHVAARDRATPQRISTHQRVVLVEDSEDIRTTLAMLLEVAGYRVTTASDGPAGAKSIVEARPDVAFVDIGLPGFDGYEVARRVRAAVGSSVRLVALTGYGQFEDRRRAQEAGFDHHLTKPVGLEDLEGAING
ncbi:MAG: hypothetical protein NVSMB47_04700 [Polyangiales bacterium]